MWLEKIIIIVRLTIFGSRAGVKGRRGFDSFREIRRFYVLKLILDQSQNNNKIAIPYKSL